MIKIVMDVRYGNGQGSTSNSGVMLVEVPDIVVESLRGELTERELAEVLERNVLQGLRDVAAHVARVVVAEAGASIAGRMKAWDPAKKPAEPEAVDPNDGVVGG